MAYLSDVQKMYIVRSTLTLVFRPYFYEGYVDGVGEGYEDGYRAGGPIPPEDPPRRPCGNPLP